MMQATKPRTKSKKPFILGKPHEEILKAVYFYRYMTAQDVAYLLYSPKSLTHVREVLAALSGGEDFKTAQYLYRFRLPSIGNSERVYTLGSKGRDYLAEELGMPVDWYFRPEKVKHLSHSYVAHSLLLTRFLVAAHFWCGKQTEFRLAKVRISYELAKKPVSVAVGEKGKEEKLTVIPDAWLLFEQLKEGRQVASFPVLLEIDRGTEYQQKFKQHVRARIAFVRSRGYKEMFGTNAVLIAYATTGEKPEYRQTRLRAMCQWTKEVLAEQHREKWAVIFRFCALSLDEMYTLSYFRQAVWFRPDVPEPVSLFAA